MFGLCSRVSRERKEGGKEERKKRRKEEAGKGGRVKEGRKERKNEIKRDFPGGSVVKTVLPMQGTWV